MDDWKAGGMVRHAVCSHAPFRARVAALVAALGALVLAHPAGTAEVGVVADVTWGQPREDVDHEIELLRAAGVRWIRANVNWAGLEPPSSARGRRPLRPKSRMNTGIAAVPGA
ncbi:MAG: hypothetical protein ACRDMY_13410 [Gaiellaceae bacterium]